MLFPDFVLLGQALIPAKVTGQHSPFLTKWMRLALRCPALFYGTLLVSSTHYTATRVDKRDETWVLVNRGQAIQALNKALADSDQAISDENIAAVINLAGHEVSASIYPQLKHTLATDTVSKGGATASGGQPSLLHVPHDRS